MLRHKVTVLHAGTDSPVEFIHGERYHPELSNKSIAKEVKLLICQAIKAGLLPSMKVSAVSSRDYVNVKIHEASFGYKSKEHAEAKELITQFMLAYQKQELWVNGDLIHNNFSSNVEWRVEPIESDQTNDCDHLFCKKCKRPIDGCYGGCLACDMDDE